MTAEGVNRQPLSSQQIRIAVLVVVAVVVGVVLFFVFHHSKNHKPGKVYQAIPSEVFTPKNLAAESRFINTRFFWAGKQQQGLRYEFTRNTKGYLYVRYLTKGAPIGNRGAGFLVIATYPSYPAAYATLKKSAKAKPGPGQSVIEVRPHDKKSVLMAFKGVPDEIEIYDPSPSVALAIAISGSIKPVR